MECRIVVVCECSWCERMLRSACRAGGDRDKPRFLNDVMICFLWFGMVNVSKIMEEE